MTGLELVQQTFANSDKRAVFMPYFAVGYPDLETSINIMETLAQAGADIIEVGVPFSDPLADGPTIQHATQIALQHGTTPLDCLEAVRELRRRGVTISLMLMSYINPLMAYGVEKLVEDANEAGVSGFIVPDLPADEAGHFQQIVDSHQMAFAHFLAPTSDEGRIQLAAAMARGFIYLVSVTGITGERDSVPQDLRKFVNRVRRVASRLAVGFGIASPEKAQAVGDIADGVIIGSRIINLADEGPQAVADFGRKVCQALEK